MNQGRQYPAGIILLRCGMVLLFLLLPFFVTVFAESDSYTMSLRASSETVAPGDTVQLAVQVHKDGWPQSGDAEVAAFQAKLEYDRASLEYVSVEIPEGTMGDFSPDSGFVLGYGEGHSFQESFDCAVLTMKVAEGVSGEISVSLTDPILARQDATELEVSPAGTLTLQVGGAASGEAPSAQSGDGAAAGTGQSGQSGQSDQPGQTGQPDASASGNNGAGVTASGPSASGSDTPDQAGESASQSGANSGTAGTDQNNGNGKKKTGAKAGTDAASSDNGSGESTAEAPDQKAAETADPALSSKEGGSDAVTTGETEERAETASRPGLWLLWGLVPLAAAAVAGICFWRKRRG